LLYWNNSTNTDAEGAAGSPGPGAESSRGSPSLPPCPSPLRSLSHSQIRARCDDACARVLGR
jgi:hypothetical protein